MAKNTTKPDKKPPVSGQQEPLVYTGATVLSPIPLRYGQVLSTVPAILQAAMKGDKQLKSYFVPLSQFGAKETETKKEGA